jgi:2-phosphosulfolactate phosphatase
MECDVVFTAKEVTAALVLEKNVVVIDVLRATSTMLTALFNGCTAIIPVKEPEEGKKLLEKELLTRGEARENYVLGGERGGVLIPGYDLGNSPLEYTYSAIGQKKLIFCTTNGTLAISKAAQAKNLYLGALLNAGALAATLKKKGDPIIFACAGTRGHYTLEDVLAAGLIMHELKNQTENVALSDKALTSLVLYRYYENDLAKVVNFSKHAKVLTALGFTKDVAYCSQKNLFDLVPAYKQGEIRLGEM